MENLMLLLNVIATIATVCSTVIAVRAKNEVKKILVNNKIQSNKGIDVGTVNDNHGVIVGSNSGEINNG